MKIQIPEIAYNGFVYDLYGRESVLPRIGVEDFQSLQIGCLKLIIKNEVE